MSANLGDDADFYLRHRSLLKRFLGKFFKHPQDIDDVVQETFLRAYQTRRSVELRSPAAFLMRVARNLALNELGARRRMLTNCTEALAVECLERSEGSAENQSMVNEQLAVFYDAAGSLPEQCQRAFLLRKVYGLSHEEIAAELKIAVSTVEKHLATGLMRCNEYMQARGHETIRRRSAGVSG